VALAGDVNLLR